MWRPVHEFLTCWRLKPLTAAPLRQSGNVLFIQRNDSLFVYQSCPLGKYSYIHRDRQHLLLDKLTELRKREGIKKNPTKADKLSRTQAIVNAAWILTLLAFAECPSSRSSRCSGFSGKGEGEIKPQHRGRRGQTFEVTWEGSRFDVSYLLEKYFFLCQSKAALCHSDQQPCFRHSIDYHASFMTLFPKNT